MPSKKHPTGDLIAALNAVQRPQCTFAAVIQTMPDAEREAVLAAVERVKADRVGGRYRSSGCTVRWLVDTLGAHGYIVPTRTTEHHVKGTCACAA